METITLARMNEIAAQLNGTYINVDGAYGNQCWDSQAKVAQLLGLPVVHTAGPGRWPGWAGNMWDAYPQTAEIGAAYYRVGADQPGAPGDIAIWGDSNPYYPATHVATVISDAGAALRCLSQNSSGPRRDLPGYSTHSSGPTIIQNLPKGGLLGYLRPRVTVELTESQRIVGSQGVTERNAPNLRDDSKTGRVFNHGDTLNFKGYVIGETANGTNKWFVGAFSGTYFSASAFDDGSTTGLQDLTPAPALTATQRVVGEGGAKKRDAPNAASAELEVFESGDVLNFKGWTRGVRPYGPGSSDVWFVGISDKFVWSGGMIGGDNLAGLPEIVLGAPPAPPATPDAPPAPVVPEPAPIPAYTFPKRWKCTTEVAPAHVSNFMRGNFPDRPTHFVVHQMDDPSKSPTLNGTIGWFQTERRNPSSAHLGAQGKRLAEIVDTVDRAYHAGTVGNNYLSCEVPPNPDAETVETVKTFLREYRDTEGYELILTTHRVIPGNSTACGTHIDLALFDISGDAPVVTPPVGPPAPAVPPVPAAGDDVEDFADFIADHLVELYRESKK